MLLQFRHMTRGAVATIILALVGLAMVAFLVPQGGLQIFPSQDLATVGDRSIRAPQLTRELELTLRGERAEGNNITQQEAIEAGVHLRLLEGMISRFALYNYADKIGVSVSDATVAERIREIPAVINPVTGSFDESAYDAFLQQLRYTRQEFEQDIRGDLTIDMMMEPLAAGVRAPSSYGALAFTYQTETRVVSIAEAPASAVGAIPPPNEAQLQAFWEENQERLRVPEFRAVTLVVADPAAFAQRVDVPEARLREEFDARRATLTRPEQRTYFRLSAQNEAQANDAVARLGRGEDPQAVASALGLQLSRGENQARSDVPDPRVAEAVFAMQPNAPARAVRGQLTPWVVVRVSGVTPAVEPSFEAMRDELRRVIALDEAADMLNEAVSGFEDARAGGATVADAARQHGLTVVTIPAVEEGGRDPSGEPVAALAEQEELLSTAFQTPEGEASDFIPAGDADVVVSVDRITPSTVRPLDEVREELTQVWLGRERTRRLREMSEEFMEAVRGGQGFAEAARAHSFSVVVPSRPIDRASAGQIPARALAAQIFGAAQGDVVSDLRVDGQAMLVAQVEEINRIDPAEQPQAVEAMRQQLGQTLTQSFGAAVQNEIVARTRVRRNENLLNQVFPRTGDSEEEQ